MGQVSTFSVLQSAMKLLLQVGLIVGGLGVFGAVVGHLGSYIIQSLVAVIALFVVRLRPWSFHLTHLLDDLRLMIPYGLPLFFGTIGTGLASQFATLVLAAFATNAVIGYYQAALNVTVPIALISAAFANVLFRSFAQLHGLEEDLSLAFAYAVKYVSLVLTPVVFFVLASAAPLFDLFYGPAFSAGIPLLRLVAVSYFPVAIGLTVLPAFLNGIGRSKFTMVIALTGALGLVFASLLFVADLGLAAQGIVFALLVSNLATAVVGILLCVRYLGVKISLKPLAAIFLAGLVAWLAVSVLPVAGVPSAAALALDFVVFLLAYFTLVPVFLGVDNDDLIRLSIAVETTGPFRVVFEAFLEYERRVLSLTWNRKT